jgi:fluoride exporter
VQLFWIAVAGGLGTALRYGVGVAAARLLGGELPYGTLLVNVVGSFVLALVAEALSGTLLLGVEASLILGVGLLGGFTTYSSFNLETLRLAQSGQLDKALLYTAATVLGCLLAGFAGLVVGRALAAH